jgi:hypothetical protein
MTVIIGIDPHKASHMAVAIDGDELRPAPHPRVAHDTLLKLEALRCRVGQDCVVIHARSLTAGCDSERPARKRRPEGRCLPAVNAQRAGHLVRRPGVNAGVLG